MGAVAHKPLIIKAFRTLANTEAEEKSPVFPSGSRRFLKNLCYQIRNSVHKLVIYSICRHIMVHAPTSLHCASDGSRALSGI